MKNSINLILLFLGLIFASCEKEIQTVMTVQLNPIFITLGEGTNEPIRLKSTANEETIPIYAIQIYENDVEFYYGLFDDVSKMQIALTTGKTYKFKVSAFKTGTGKGLKTLNDADGVNYYLPNKIPLKNMFIKGDLLKDIDLISSIILNGQQKDYPEIDGFYTTKTIIIENGTNSIDFALLRMGFGLNLNVDALTSGNMEVYLGNDTIKLNSSQTTASTVRLFNVLNGNFTNIHSKSNTYSDSILLKVKWTGTNGTVVNTQEKYLFNRNYQKTINIQLNTLTGGLTFENWKFPPDGLVAWYLFSGNANDESGNGNNGNLIGGMTYQTDRFGNSNSAVKINNGSDLMSTTTAFTNPNPFSLSIWFKASTNDTGSLMLGFNNGKLTHEGLWDRVLYITDKQIGFYVYPNYITQDINLKDNVWHHCALTFGSSGLKLYIDGKLILQNSINTAQNYTGYWRLGGLSPNDLNNSFTGLYDDFGIWNRALTQEEITKLYNYKSN
jgi:hypothetical protein